MEGNLHYLCDRYSNEEITTQINKAILNEGCYQFFILNPDDGLGLRKPAKYYPLSIHEINQIKKAHFLYQRAKITVRKNTIRFTGSNIDPKVIGLPESSTEIDYRDLLGEIFNVSEINNKEWLARGDWYRYEAACIFAQVNPESCRKFDFHNVVYLTDSKAQKYLEIIDTWYIGLNKLVCASSFWYINKAIKEDLLELPSALLNEVKRYIEKRLPIDREKFLKSYPYIDDKLNVSSIKNHPKGKTEGDSREFLPSTPSSIPESKELSDVPISDKEAQELYWKNPQDRNPRLFKRSLEIAETYKNTNEIKLDAIHDAILIEEEGISDVSKATLKHVVKLKDIINAIKKKKAQSEKVN